ncbi:MAG: CHASE2 domain-containing protein [Gomphosphaeria aponina SAG 52.96 = DSM 107014]|uniref:CHASE2 domain-containing protein n=1 Tax=Gomphosphaeria aponina SAG 52.96 = DSM 107014 TaxID=1521640 RepID=A0A941GNY1_9CHRO|nr:CHASE2 domain-containing protein [Gomphosphaeria aponina SAG 52.96 = DSM 107014]
MDKLVVLQIDESDLGFQVTLEIGDEGHRAKLEITGSLPANEVVMKNHESWRTFYHKINVNSRLGGPSGQSTNYAGDEIIDQCSSSLEKLTDSFHDWLKSPGFTDINDQLRTHLNQEDQVRFLIKTTNDIRKLPWHSWHFFTEYNNAYPAISPVCFKAPPPVKTKKKKVKILAIIGDSTGIDVKKDQLYLKQLPDAEVVFLVEPTRGEISKKLWQQQWDMIFFAGHSSTKKDKGVIYINKTEKLTVAEVQNGLEEAINQGLQIAIFNSCDGLGLAWELERLNIPEVIVMAEPVPDLVAQEFLKSFLGFFTKGDSLYLAVKKARKKLEDDGWNERLPGATLLPVIYQNPGVIPPNWQDFLAGPMNKRGLVNGVLTSLVCTGVVGIIRYLGLLQGLELSAFDTMMQWRSHSSMVQDERILVVTIDDEDIAYQTEQNWPRKTGGSLTDEALSRLLDELAKVNPEVIGLNIYHQHDFAQGISDRLNQNYPFYVMCKTNSPQGQDTQPPKDISPDFWGFSDVIMDSDRVVRRHLMSMIPQAGDTCKTDLAFNSLIAFYYLNNLGIDFEETDKGWKIGSNLLPKLTKHAGGYQGIDSRGSQTILNYRYVEKTTDIAASVSLKDVLTQGISGKYPIVIIGVTAQGEKFDDYFLTPYGDEIPGVFLQAQMISQIISVGVDSQPAIWWWPVQIELLWILGWSMMGGILAYYIRDSQSFILAQVIIFGGLGVSCWLIFSISGGWIPLIPPALALGATTIIIAAPPKLIYK